MNHIFNDYSLILCMMFGCVLMTVWWLKFQKKLNLKWYIAPILAIAHFVVGIIVMKFWALVEVGFDWNSAVNMRLFGAMFLMPPLYYLGARITKRDPYLIMDIAAIACVIGLFVGRINCLTGNCCQGRLISDESLTRWPLREIELVFCIIFCVCFWQAIYKNKTKGIVFPVLMIIYGVMRFVLEWFREEYTGKIGIFHLAHIWSVISMTIGFIALIIIFKKSKLKKG